MRDVFLLFRKRVSLASTFSFRTSWFIREKTAPWAFLPFYDYVFFPHFSFSLSLSSLIRRWQQRSLSLLQAAVASSTICPAGHKRSPVNKRRAKSFPKTYRFHLRKINPQTTTAFISSFWARWDRSFAKLNSQMVGILKCVFRRRQTARLTRGRRIARADSCSPRIPA